ncbi:hypothetical protein BDK51DRAFT_27562 [Blyttiomyces helicus]|uniref:DNA polymerase n=1 Tax=Blyttiomyces helicus TaxID=388810 RepID=A0A4P9W9G3_9FUNG|nr:hypothetical protein BDK51DRAFT_27562 [Blyttiomyces helicus]|eukprot:RKO88812.1 hypothetical protein BDK51DRAFT_27562 [Blyttiomyces helicus]
MAFRIRPTVFPVPLRATRSSIRALPLSRPSSSLTHEDPGPPKGFTRSGSSGPPVKPPDSVAKTPKRTFPTKISIDETAPINHNKKITDILAELGKHEEINGNVSKGMAYSKAVKALSSYPTPLTSGTEARSVKGIGESIGVKIDNIISKGKLDRLEEELADSKLQAIKTLMTVPMDVDVAKDLVSRFGTVVAEDPVAFSQTPEGRATLALRRKRYPYIQDFQKKIPRDEITKWKELLMSVVGKDPETMAAVMGSYRRGAPESGSISILVTHATFDVDEAVVGTDVFATDLIAGLNKELVLHELIRTKRRTFTTVECAGKLSRESEVYRRVMITVCGTREWPTRMVRFTGPAQYWHYLTERADKEKLVLRPEGLFHPLPAVAPPGHGVPLVPSNVKAPFAPYYAKRFEKPIADPARRIALESESALMQHLHLPVLQPHERE